MMEKTNRAKMAMVIGKGELLCDRVKDAHPLFVSEF
jgi:hypothetical protein